MHYFGPETAGSNNQDSGKICGGSGGFRPNQVQNHHPNWLRFASFPELPCLRPSAVKIAATAVSAEPADAVMAVIALSSLVFTRLHVALVVIF